MRQKIKKEKRILSVCCAVAFVIFTLCFGTNAYAATGVNVDYHTQDEIKEYLQQSGASVNDAVTFEILPQIHGYLLLSGCGIPW